MPTYDFVCLACEKRFEVFMTFSEYGSKPVYCTHCESDKVRRRMTKVRIARSDESRLESMANDFPGMDGLEDDPKALGQMMRKLGGETGENLPPEFGEVVDRLEAGQSPEEIESALPDVGIDDSSDN
ncbi:MAG: zinc ribbon domain-containing protein [Anaerolineales bacterium]